jgi:hypothetical protein
MNIDYYAQYININFDEILLENNNSLVNSEEFYLMYKKDYFDQTSKNFEKYKKWDVELQELTNFNVSESTKYKYVYTNLTKVEFLKQELKNLIIAQNKLLDNFHHYVTLLNTHPEKFKVKTEDVQQKRSFLSKLLTSKKGKA